MSERKKLAIIDPDSKLGATTGQVEKGVIYG
jgi:hypothetical protein